jgi:soluble lytic murein transglycosylase-like protein
VVASRDAKGRLTIANLAPPGRAAPGAPSAVGTLEALILEAAQTHRLPAPLVAALIKVESNFATWAVSPKGAMGLMQLMPGTAAFLGVTDPFCPRQNVWAGCRYLRLLLDTFGDCLPLALAAYNAGFQRVINAGYRVPPIRETQEFVTQVLERYFTAAYGLSRVSAQEGPQPRAAPPFT